VHSNLGISLIYQRVKLNVLDGPISNDNLCLSGDKLVYEFYCVLENGEYGTWHKAPLEYDAAYKDKQRAIDHAKEFSYGVVHKLSLNDNGWFCDVNCYSFSLLTTELSTVSSIGDEQ